jgi:NAD(P)-dependent dehydrogenase (short-subunit alcohol dehydrogenase family)
METVMLITGRSRGIGAAAAWLAAALGYSVCINYRKERE